MPQVSSFAIFTHALATVRNNLGVAWAVFWPWAIVGVLIIVGLVAVIGIPDPSATMTTDGMANEMRFSGLRLLANIAQIVIAASIAVNWHRYVLLDEFSQSIGGRLRLDAHVWRYAGNVFLVSLILIALVLVTVLALILVLMGLGGANFTAGSPPSGLAILLAAIVAVVGFCWAMLVMMRLMVKLPAVAVGRTDYGFGRALADTKGHSMTILGMMGLNLLLVFGVLLAGGLVIAGIATISPMLAIGLAVVAYLVFIWFFTIFNVSQLTTLYGVYAEGREV